MGIHLLIVQLWMFFLSTGPGVHIGGSRQLFFDDFFADCFFLGGANILKCRQMPTFFLFLYFEPNLVQPILLSLTLAYFLVDSLNAYEISQ